MSRPPAPRAFHGDEARRLMAVVSRIETAARSLGARRVHTPAIVPVEVHAALTDSLAPGVVLPEVRDGLSDRVRGALCPVGGAIEAIPILRGWVRSHRDLPMAIFRAGQAVWPFPGDRPAAGWEELLCISGAVARRDGSAPMAAELVESCLGALGLRGAWREERWLLLQPARVLRLDDVVLAVAQPIPTAGPRGRPGASRLAPAFIDEENRRRAAHVELFYISEQALLMAAAQPAAAAEART